MMRSRAIRFIPSGFELITMLVAAAFLLLAFPTPPAHAQTFRVIHTFTGESDGSNPGSGLTLDRAGNLYGTTGLGGNSSEYCGTTCGMVFKLDRAGSGWIYNPLYLFPGGLGGPGGGRLTFGPNGSLYGLGGDASYNLQPPPTRCGSLFCQWNNTILYSFCCGSDFAGGLTFDHAGNIYAGSFYGGDLNRGFCEDAGCGYIYQLAPSSGGWTQNILYEFHFSDGAYPNGQLIFDQAGNLYGTTVGLSEDNNGNVFELTPTASGYWNETILYTFQGGSNGKYPYAGVIFDPCGNLYGATAEGGANNGGTIFELTSNGWSFNLLYALPSGSGYPAGVNYSMVMDSAGNIYGTTFTDGANNLGSVFKLTRSSGGWSYTSLHDFTGGSDGAYPVGSLAIDSNGNLYGAAEAGGNSSPACDENFSYQCGVLFEITP